jgi:tRNA(Ile2) C34 agmatinyltransferase TiaS
MNIIAKCPHCGYRWWLDAAAADRRIRCRKCRTLLKVPDLTEIPDAADIISQARSDVYVDDAGKTYG